MKNAHLILVLLFCGIAWACQRNTEQPELSDTTISRIMADLYVAEAATNGLGGYAKDSLMHAYHEQIFKIHGVTRAVYEKDVRLIAQDEMHMEAVVDSAIALLQPKDVDVKSNKEK